MDTTKVTIRRHKGKYIVTEWGVHPDGVARPRSETTWFNLDPALEMVKTLVLSQGFKDSRY
jgi:hypothetical protein